MTKIWYPSDGEDKKLLVELDDEADTNGWGKYSKLVLHELQRLNQCREKDLKEHQEFKDCVKRSFEGIRIDLAVLKVKAGVWGFIGAAIPILIWIMIEVFMHYKFGTSSGLPKPPLGPIP